MNRRDATFALLTLGAAPFNSVAQQADKVWRVGLLYTRSRPTTSTPDPYLSAFLGKLREHGYVEGKNLHMEWRFADGKVDRLPGMAEDLVRTGVDVLVTHSMPTTLAAKRATSAVPIVVAAMSDPVGSGLAKSFSRPGGNITGLSLMSVEVSPKRVELLSSIVPKLSRIAFLMNPLTLNHAGILKSTQVAAQLIEAKILPVEARSLEEIERAFVTMAGWGAEALVVAPDAVFIGQRRQIAQLSLKSRIPAIFAFRQDAEAGGLLSYGQDVVELYRLAAGYVDKILKGAKPAELPIEQPSTFELIINMKTAKALGIAIPQAVLLRASEVIE